MRVMAAFWRRILERNAFLSTDNPPVTFFFVFIVPETGGFVNLKENTAQAGYVPSRLVKFFWIFPRHYSRKRHLAALQIGIEHLCVSPSSLTKSKLFVFKIEIFLPSLHPPPFMLILTLPRTRSCVSISEGSNSQ